MDEQYLNHIEWLKRAKSSLAIAKNTRITKEIFWEDICFFAYRGEFDKIGKR